MSERGNTKELVSVIIPTYNRLELLKRSVESVIAQTYENWELIVVDDCSDDGTKEYIEGLKDPRVSCYRNESNMGPAASRNIGAAKAKGSLLAFQDSDDVWMPDKLEKTVSALLSAPDEYGMAYHEVREEGGNMIPDRSVPLENKTGNIFSYLLLFPLIDTPASVIKKSCFEACGGFCEELKSMEDYEFFLRVSKAYPILFVGEPLINSFNTKGSVNKRQKSKIDTEVYVLQEMQDELMSRDLLEQKIALIRLQGENYGCEDYVYNKLETYAAGLKAAGEPEKAVAVLSAMEQVMEKATDAVTERREFYKEAPSQIQRLADSLERFAGRIKGAKLDALAKKNAFSALKDVWEDLEVYEAVFPEAYERQESNVFAIQNKNGGNIDAALKQNLTLARKLQELVKNDFHACAACGAEALFMPVSGSAIQYKDRCPYCGAYTGTRFLQGFLEDVQPEGEEKLVIGCLEEKDKAFQLADFIKAYAEGKSYMQYKMLLPENSGSKPVFDVLVLKALPHTTGEWQRIRETLKPGGFFVTFDRGNENKNVSETGFEEASIDINWFGEEYFHYYGFAPEVCLKMYTQAE
ncbi:MAG: glycosyltransferase family 2 protein [Lachnospiraceae bacterium]|nr:glycosyltransferase family 2 protein [Lachnospiraceae bacterium]